MIKYIIGDFISANVAWFLYNLYRYYTVETYEFLGSLKSYLAFPRIIEGQILFPLLFIFLFILSGYYNQPYLKSRLSEFFSTFFSVMTGVFLLFFIAIINDIQRIPLNSYAMLGVMFLIMFCCVYAVRAVITYHATKKIHDGYWGFNTLIIGTGNHAANLYRELTKKDRSLGYNIQGFIKTDDEKEEVNPLLPNFPVYSISDIETSVKQFNIEELIISLDRHNRSTLHKVINRLYPLNLPIRLQINEFEMLTSHIKLSNIYGTPLIDISKCSLSECEKNLKRFFDIIGSSLALIILSPVYLFLAIRIKCGGKGPVIYRQKRIGFRRKEFTLYKFRTMVNDAEKNGPSLSKENDTRITSFGRIMRKYRLDELPQFWNVLKGDMSIVGPRPEREYYIDQIIKKAPHYSLLHQIRPGITSWGMVKYGYARNIDEMIKRLKYEILYLENMSLLVDLKIIIYTIKTVFTGKGL
ncbi:sugar transferase [Coprobacter tertius]|uniref:Sugar transferase n=1 Tax=Coprobacter tertius TaxID=2944915 RepID=A0ABT1MEH0_9BACT|nr:sugar transferase [Coprobacter tertius]MCP9611022.1 sugar transferase [Coprobacter tertius]